MKRTEHTQKWLDALRGGEYKQTRGFMWDGKDGYCCLAVGLQVLVSDDFDDLYQGFDLSRCEVGDLIRMNDREKKTFPEIADAIEKMLESEAA